MNFGHRRATGRATAQVPLLLWLALALIWPATQAGGTLSLDQAIASGVVSATAAPGNDFSRLALTITPNAEPVMIAVLPGTRFVPEDPALAEVISVERIERLVQGETVIDPLPVASLSSSKPGPSPLDATAYTVAGLAPGTLLNLLADAEARGLSGSQATQLAVWATAEERSLEEVVAGLPVPPTAADIEAARGLLAGVPLPTTAPMSGAATVAAPEETAPAPTGPDPEPSLLLLVLAGVFGFLLLAAAIAGVATLSQRKAAPSEARRARDREPESGSGSPARARRSPTAGSTPAGGAPRDPTQFGNEQLSLTCSSGPNAGKQITITGNTVIAKSNIGVQSLPLAGLSSPHVYLYWSDRDVSVKDLNSAGGTELDGRPLSKDMVTASFGSNLRLGGSTIARLTDKGVLIDGALYRAHPDGLMLSYAPVTVHSLGKADKTISDPHCVILRSDTGYDVRDLNSRNGVYLGEERVAIASRAIADGATLRLGKETTFGCSLG